MGTHNSTEFMSSHRVREQALQQSKKTGARTAAQVYAERRAAVAHNSSRPNSNSNSSSKKVSQAKTAQRSTPKKVSKYMYCSKMLSSNFGTILT